MDMRDFLGALEESNGNIFEGKEGKADWKRELESRLNVFKSRSIRSFSKIDLSKPVETALIIAMDTSGSMVPKAWEKVFGEMDNIASNFEIGASVGGSTIKGQVYFMAWDMAVEQVEKYKPGGWKAYVSDSPQSKNKKNTAGGVVGSGGGTDPTCIYKYMDKHYLYDPDTQKNAAIINLLGDPKSDFSNNIVIPVKKGIPEVLPFLIVATDGYFNKMSESSLGKLYKNGKDNIVYLITEGTSGYVYPNDAMIEI